jgi:hypothetical protein
MKNAYVKLATTAALQDPQLLGPATDFSDTKPYGKERWLNFHTGFGLYRDCNSCSEE